MLQSYLFGAEDALDEFGREEEADVSIAVSSRTILDCFPSVSLTTSVLRTTRKLYIRHFKSILTH